MNDVDHPATDHPETQYLDLLRRIVETGDERIDRTRVGTRAVFGATMSFDTARHFPVITTKKVAWVKAIHETLWFLSGSTSIRPLIENDVHIWSEWPHAAYVRKTGDAIDLKTFEARVLGDDAFSAAHSHVGRLYGTQWRDWIGPDGRHHDQMGAALATLKSDPASRRMLWHAWNVGELDGMVLAPCHLLYQLTAAKGRVNLIVTQRSCDTLLGVPFNIVGSAALLAIFAQQAGLEPGELIWFGADVHVYLNHLDAVAEQLTRTPRGSPQLRLLRKPDSLDDYRIGDFAIDGYDPHPTIRAPIAV